MALLSSIAWNHSAHSNPSSLELGIKIKSSLSDALPSGKKEEEGKQKELV